MSERRPEASPRKAATGLVAGSNRRPWPTAQRTERLTVADLLGGPSG
jgi:hypothetical protein